MPCPGSTWALAVSASTLGRAHLTGQRWLQARESLEFALAEARGHKLGLEAEASYLALLAEALAENGELDKALVTAEEAVKVAGCKKTLFWELQARITLAGILLRREQLEDRPRITKSLERAEELVAKTGGEVMKLFVLRHQADLARLNGDDDAYQRILRKAHRLFKTMGAYGHAERLAVMLRNIEGSFGSPEDES